MTLMFAGNFRTIQNLSEHNKTWAFIKELIRGPFLILYPDMKSEINNLLQLINHNLQYVAHLITQVIVQNVIVYLKILVIDSNNYFYSCYQI